MGFFAWAAQKIDEAIRWYRFDTLYAKERRDPPTHDKPTDISKEIATMGPEAIPYLEKRFREGDDDERMRVVFNLQAFTDTCAIPLLIEALKDENKDISGSAITPLRRFGSQAVPALMKLASEKDNRCLDARLEAIFILGGIGDRRATATLIGNLGDVLPDVREYSIIALNRIKDDTAIPAMVFRLEDKNDYVRAAAASAFVEMPDDRAIPGLLDMIDTPLPERKTQGIETPKEKIVKAAKAALAKTGLSAFPALFDLAVMNRSNHADVIVQIGDPAIPFLINHLKDAIPERRRVAASLLGKTERGKAEKAISTPALVSLLKDPKPAVRKEATDALNEINDFRALHALRKMMKSDPDPDVRATALTNLVLIAERNNGDLDAGKDILLAAYDAMESYESTGSKTHMKVTMEKCMGIFNRLALSGMEEIDLARISSAIKRNMEKAKALGDRKLTQAEIAYLSGSYMRICENMRNRKTRLFDDGEILCGIPLKTPKGADTKGMFRTGRRLCT